MSNSPGASHIALFGDLSALTGYTIQFLPSPEMA